MSGETSARFPGHATIRRGRMRADSFTHVSNALARDKRLSRRARGLFLELASHQEGWQTSLTQLLKGGPEGKDALRGAIHELEKYGYLVRTQGRGEEGKFGGAEYWITDCPEDYLEDSPSSEPSSENPTTDETGKLANPAPSSDFPTTAKPTSANPTSGNPPPKKTSLKNTNTQKTNPQEPESFASAQDSAAAAPQQTALDGMPAAPELPAKPDKPTPPQELPELTAPPQNRDEALPYGKRLASEWLALLKGKKVTVIDRSRSAKAGSSKQPFWVLTEMFCSALIAGATPLEIKHTMTAAFQACGNPVPPAAIFDRHLLAVQGTYAPPTYGQRRATNLHIDPDVVATLQQSLEDAL